MKKSMKIEVRPVPKKPWHKKTEKESFTRPKKIQALVDTSTMMYATGLTKEDLAYLKGKTNYDLSPDFDQENPHPFWDSPMAVIKLENGTMIFDEAKPLDYIKICMMKASSYIANSYKQWKDGEFPEATHIIYDEREEIEAKASKVEIRKQATIKSAELSKDRKIQLIMILAGKDLKGKNDNFVEVELDKIIQTDPKELLRMIQEKTPEQIENHSFVLEALDKSILKKKGHKIMYFESTLGNDVDDVVKYFGDTENQELMLKIKKDLNNE